MKARTLGFLAALALLSGCGTTPTDYPLATGQANQTQAPLDADPDHPFVVLAFSGGGSRAAAFAAAVVERPTICITRWAGKRGRSPRISLSCPRCPAAASMPPISA